MKHFLPKNTQGFTLVELLVVISIIAILSIIGITIFTGTQKTARDARRQADVNAIATALENKRVPNVSTYPQISAADFARGTLPVDTTDAKYCVADSTTAGASAPAMATSWDPTEACPAGYNVIDGSSPVDSATAWTICALLEGGNAPNIYCRSNSQ